MKKSIYLAAAVLSLIFVWSFNSWAEDKIGFINVNEIIRTSKAGQKKLNDFKKYFDDKQSQIKSMEKELTAMKDELDKKGPAMDEKKLMEKQTAYQKKVRDLQILVTDAEDELKRRDQNAIQILVPEVLKIVKKIAEKEKYTLVLDISTTQLPYFDTGKDFSKRVVEEFDKTN